MEKSEIKGFIAKRVAKELKDGDVVNLGIGIPSAMENSVFQLGRIVVVSMISLSGTVQIAANAVANNLDGLAIIPGQAYELAMIAVVGRCIGARDMRQDRYYTGRLMKGSYLSLAAVSLVLSLIHI